MTPFIAFASAGCLLRPALGLRLDLRLGEHAHHPALDLALTNGAHLLLDDGRDQLAERVRPCPRP
jgi:hypothetical protein